MNLNNLKYKAEYEYYNSYQGDKVKYGLYRQRFLVGIPKERAIIPGNIRLLGKIKENGRICNKCGLFKEWNKYSKDNRSKLGYIPSCKECINKSKSEYRKTQNGKQVTKNYHIKYRANILNREHEKQIYREWQIKNKEHLKLNRQKWFQENKKEIQERRRQREYERYLQGEFIIYNGNKCKILQDYNKRQGLLIKVGEIRIFIRKSQCKPFIEKNKYKF